MKRGNQKKGWISLIVALVMGLSCFPLLSLAEGETTATTTTQTPAQTQTTTTQQSTTTQTTQEPTEPTTTATTTRDAMKGLMSFSEGSGEGSFGILQAPPVPAGATQVATELEFRAALANTAVTDIELTGGFSLTTSGAGTNLTIGRDVTIHGNGNTITNGYSVLSNPMITISSGTVTFYATNFTSSGTFQHQWNRAFWVTGGKLVLDEVTISGFGPEIDTGAAVNISGGILEITDSTIQNNTAGSAGGVHVSGGTANITNTNFTGNATRSGGGGAIAVTGAATLNMNGGSITNNTVNTNVNPTGAGGMIVSTNGIANLTNVTMSGNTVNTTSVVRGSAIYVQSGGKLNYTGGVIKNHTSHSGGAIYNAGCTVNLTGTTLESNKANKKAGANGEGGAIYSESGVVNMNGGFIKSNQSEAAGSGIYATGSAQINLTNGAQISDNQGTAGAIYLDTTSNTAKISLDNSSVIQNTANYGGGIYAAGPYTVDVKNNSKVSNNTANQTFAGGIYAANGVTVNVDNSAVNGNTAPAAGGILADAATVNIKNGSTVNNNTATSTHGGGIYATRTGASGQSTINILNSTLSTNKANVNQNMFGGGVYAKDYTTLKAEDSTFEKNEGGLGGGIYVATNTGNALTLNRDVFSENIANAGGAIWTPAGFSYQTTECTFANNKAQPNGITETDGGAIFLSDGSTYTSNNCSFENNEANRWGGAIMANVGSTVSINESSFSGNNATNFAGALYVIGSQTKESILTVDDSDFHGNTARYGGAIGVFNNTKATIQNGSIIQNNSSTNIGGGLVLHGSSTDVAEQPTLIFTGASKVLNNSTAGFGGGIHSQDVKLLQIKNNSEFVENRTTGNYSGGGIFMLRTNLDVSSATISKNHVTAGTGGGMYINNSNSYNRTYTVDIQNSTISENTGSGYGAGIALTGVGTNLTAQNMTLTKNAIQKLGTLNAAGGGMYMTGGATAKLKGCNVSENTADGNGGGVFLSDNDTSLTLGGTEPVNIVNFTKNEATLDGGAIWTDNLNRVSGNQVKFENNLAQDHSYTSDADKILHDSLLSNVVNHFNKGVDPDYTSYNNYDIVYKNSLSYTVNFDTMGGAQSYPSQSGIRPNRPANDPGTPTRNGYIFSGWYTSPTGGSIWNFISSLVNGNITLYARWTPTTTPTTTTTTTPTTAPTTTPTTAGPTPPTTTTPTPTPTPTTVAPGTDTTIVVAAVDTDVTPPSTAALMATTVLDTEEIDNGGTPLGGGWRENHWALLNLLLAIACCVASVVLLIGYFIGRKHRDEENEVYDQDDEETRKQNELKRKGIWRILSILPAVVSVIVFILTEDMTNPMVFVDKWTLLMAIFALVQLIVVIMSMKRHKDNDPETREPATEQ